MTEVRDALVTFGETMLRLSPTRGERLETTTNLDAQAGGAESNVAVAASQLGADAVWLSKLPDSALGRRIERELRGHGVDVDVAWDDGPDARLGTYFLEFGGEPRGVDVTYDRADASVTTVSPDELAVERVESARWFHTTGITPALSERAAETTAALLDAAGEGGATRSFDLNYRSKLWNPETAAAAYEALFPRVDVLFAPERDAKETLGVTGDAAAVARELDAEYGFDAVVVTRGEEGALVLADGELHEQGVFDAETFDAIGTGDAFVGGFIARRLAGGDRPDALEWGAATAALKRTLAGDAAVVTPAEVERVIDEQDGGISR